MKQPSLKQHFRFFLLLFMIAAVVRAQEPEVPSDATATAAEESPAIERPCIDSNPVQDGQELVVLRSFNLNHTTWGHYSKFVTSDQSTITAIQRTLIRTPVYVVDGHLYGVDAPSNVKNFVDLQTGELVEANAFLAQLKDENRRVLKDHCALDIPEQASAYPRVVTAETRFALACAMANARNFYVSFADAMSAQVNRPATLECHFLRDGKNVDAARIRSVLGDNLGISGLDALFSVQEQESLAP